MHDPFTAGVVEALFLGGGPLDGLNNRVVRPDEQTILVHTSSATGWDADPTEPYPIVTHVYSREGDTAVFNYLGPKKEDL